MNKDKGKHKKTGKAESLEPNVSEAIIVEEEKEAATEEITEETGSKEKDTRVITITVDYYENVAPLHPISDIVTKCKYQDMLVGETSHIPVTDNPNLAVEESFSFKVNVNSKKDMDNLISTPAILTISQYAGTCDPTLYEQLQQCERPKSVTSVKSFDSIVSIYEAFTGDTVDRDIVDGATKKVKLKSKKTEKKTEKKVKEKSTKSSRPSKSSKPVAVKKQKQKKTDTVSMESDVESKPMVYGMCVIDFLPLFNGKLSYTECLVINPIEKYTDERMTTYKKKPQVIVSISVDKEICFPNSVVLNVTLESIYQIPSVMKPEMDYKVCVALPARDPIIFSNPLYSSRPFPNALKSWPGVKRMGQEANSTKYKVGECELKNNTDEEDIESCLIASGPRLRYNVLKRNLLMKDAREGLSYHLSTYRKILLEIYACTKEKGGPSSRAEVNNEEKALDRRSNPSLRSLQKLRTSELATRKKSSTFLHLMAIADVSLLLYPGVTKVRVAAPLTTFSYDEALTKVGVNDSFFVPKPVEVDFQETSTTDIDGFKNDRKGDKSKKKEKSSVSKSTKASKKGGPKGEEQNGNNLKYLLPGEPESAPIPEPSIPVFNENGKQTFVIIEVELSQAINKKRDVEDLNQELKELLHEKKGMSPKIVLTHHLTKDYYKEVLNQISTDMYEKYKTYLSSIKGNIVTEKDFIKYLESIGAYQAYLSSIKEAVSVLTSTKFRLDDTDKKSHLYQNFISEIFVYLVAEMNDTLNRLICSGLEPITTPKPETSDTLLVYAKEAAALKQFDLAERYYLERICYNESDNADNWFDYAVFNLEIKQTEKAYECVIEALSKKPTHRYSLLLLGGMLASKGQKDDAETCFLNLLVHEPRWMEGWLTLYLFYEKYDSYEGMDMTMDMARKYLDDKRVASDYFNKNEDLSWTPEICPDTMFFRTTILLLKMRLYEWVEMALAHEIQQHMGEAHYLLSVVCLYQNLNEQALEHIHHAKACCSPNYGLSSLSGHCLFAMNKQVEAREEYYFVLQSVDRPNDIHLVYINCAQILDGFGNHQEARKWILLACKYTPTHYTWFKAGQLYLLENDILSAEECFSEANIRDNRCPEYWGYLALINLQLTRLDEAELCYSQAIRNNLNEEMCEKLKKEFRKLNQMAV